MSKSILHSTRLISLVTLSSRVTGLLRDILVAAWFGNNWIQDRLNYAFLMPNIFRQLLGEGALSAAFIPVLSEKLHQEDKSAVGKLVGNVATVLAVILTALTALILVLIGVFWFLSSRGEYANLTAGLTAVMMPYMIFVCLVALFSGLLNCLDHFGLPAFMPVVMNMFQVIGVLFAWKFLRRTAIPPQHQVYIVGLAVLASGVVQLLWIVRAVRRTGVVWSWDFSLESPDLRRIVVTMLPMIFGLGILQFSTYLDNQIMLSLSATEKPTFVLFGHAVRYPLNEGALSAVNQARRLYNFPLGVLGIALATAAFPAFSRYAAAGDHKSLANLASRSLRLAIFEGLPTGVGLMVLSHLIVRVLYQRGHFTAEDTAQTAFVLKFYALGIWAYCCHHIIVRAFYSLKDTMTPLRVMGKTISAAVLANLALIWVPSLREGVFGLSTTIMASLNVLILGYMLSRRIGSLEFGEILRTTVKTVIASIAMAVAVLATEAWLPVRNKYLLLLVCIAVAALVFFPICRMLGIEEAKEFLSRSRTKRSSSDPVGAQTIAAPATSNAK
jgi:putative peptidoglycan lipid II flippase